MTDETSTPQARQTDAPSPPPDPSGADRPSMTAAQSDAGARRRASAAKEFPVAGQAEVERSSAAGGPPSDVPASVVAPPPPLEDADVALASGDAAPQDDDTDEED